MQLNGKVALVTGSSRGIGRAIALELARAGADVVVAARSETQRSVLPGTIHRTAEEIAALGRRSLAVKADLTVPQEVEALARESIDFFGRVDIVVNNAAYTGSSQFATFWEMTPESWLRQIALNLSTPFLLCKALVPSMREHGGGVVINMSSAAARNEPEALPGEGAPGVAYPVSKAGIERLTSALAKEFRPFNIAIIALDPGFTMTEAVQAMASDRRLTATNAHPLDVPARAVAYLASCDDRMKYSGQTLRAEDLVRDHNLLRS